MITHDEAYAILKEKGVLRVGAHFAYVNPNAAISICEVKKVNSKSLRFDAYTIRPEITSTLVFWAPKRPDHCETHTFPQIANVIPVPDGVYRSMLSVHELIVKAYNRFYPNEDGLRRDHQHIFAESEQKDYYDKSDEFLANANPGDAFVGFDDHYMLNYFEIETITRTKTHTKATYNVIKLVDNYFLFEENDESMPIHRVRRITEFEFGKVFSLAVAIRREARKIYPALKALYPDD